jgi:mannan endo-1,4-beta-mannosidase
MAPSPDVLKAQPGWTWFMIWADIVDFNALEALRAIFDSPNVLTRNDPQVAEPMAAIRNASALPNPQPVTPGPTPEAKSLLARLYSASGKTTLSGQENSPSSAAELTDRVFAVAGKYPVIYGQDLAIPNKPGSGLDLAWQAIVDEAKRQYQNSAIVSLTWHAPRPTDDPPTSDSAHGQLTDFEWSELLTPGTDLNKRWRDQVDQVAATLKQLQDAGVPVLWRPYPESNGSHFWWAGRKGVRGSAVLYRQLYDRLVNTHGLRNLIWVWVAAAPGFGPDTPGRYSDFFPGLTYVDALSVDVAGGSFRFPLDVGLSLEGAGKVIGLGLSGKLPPAEVFTQQPRWAWFLVSPDVTESPDQSDALRALYQGPHVVSRSAEAGARAGAHPR